MVGAVGKMVSMKRRKLWKMGEDGVCCSSSAIQTRLGPSTLLVALWCSGSMLASHARGPGFNPRAG